MQHVTEFGRPGAPLAQREQCGTEHRQPAATPVQQVHFMTKVGQPAAAPTQGPSSVCGAAHVALEVPAGASKIDDRGRQRHQGEQMRSAGVTSCAPTWQ